MKPTMIGRSKSIELCAYLRPAQDGWPERAAGQQMRSEADSKLTKRLNITKKKPPPPPKKKKKTKIRVRLVCRTVIVRPA